MYYDNNNKLQKHTRDKYSRPLTDFFSQEKAVQDTSQAHYKKMMKYKYGVETWYARIIEIFEEEPGDMCIAEVVKALESKQEGEEEEDWKVEKSTISARMFELRQRKILVFSKKRPSTTSGITSTCYRLKDNYQDIVELIDFED